MPWAFNLNRNKYKEAVCYVSTVDCTPTLSHRALLTLIYSSLKIGPTPKKKQITPPPFLNEVTTKDAFLFLVHAKSTKEKGLTNEGRQHLHKQAPDKRGIAESCMQLC